jgi:hypothetical protein
VLREYQEVLDLDFTDYDEKLTDDARRRVLQALPSVKKERDINIPISPLCGLPSMQL